MTGEELGQQMPRSHSAVSEDSIHCIIFQDDSKDGTIRVMQAQDPTVRRGTSFWDLCGLTETKVEKVRKTLHEEHIMWLHSDLGLGVLYDVFYPWTGCVLYLHIHDDIEAAETLQATSLWARDIAPCPFDIKRKAMDDHFDCVQTYEVIKHRFRMIDLARNLFHVDKDDRLVEKAWVMRYLQQVAEWTGCILSMPTTETTRDARTYDGPLIRFLYMSWFLLLRDISADKKTQAILYQEDPQATSCMCLKLQCRKVEGEIADLGLMIGAMESLVEQGEQHKIYTRVDGLQGQDVVSVTVKYLQKSPVYVQSDYKTGHGEPLDYSYSQRMKR